MSGAVRKFSILVRPAEEGGFWGEVLELPGCVSQGETEQELYDNIIEAIHACLEAEDGDLLPDTHEANIWKFPVAV